MQGDAAHRRRALRQAIRLFGLDRTSPEFREEVFRHPDLRMFFRETFGRGWLAEVRQMLASWRPKTRH